MKKTTLLLFAMLMISASITAKKTPVGKWLLAKVEMEGKTQEIYSEVEFKNDGYISMDGMVFGEWKYNKKSNTITIESDMIKEFAGERKIDKLNKKELVLTDSKTKMYFEKLLPKKILKDNTNSGLQGTWKATMNDMNQTIIFELPKSIRIIETGDGSESTSRGEWIYNSDDKSLILMTRFNGLRGKVSLEKISEKEFVINSNGTKVIATKLEKSKTTIERLSFTEEDFYTEEGEPKYSEDVQKLPWIEDNYKMIQDMEEVISLTYTMSTLIKNTDTFDTVELVSAVSSQPSDARMVMDNIFIGFDRQSAPDDYEMPTVTFDLNQDNWDKNLYPFIATSYRVISQNEETTVSAGTFVCTTIEFVGDREENIKIWMVNDKPGIVAKAIKESTDPFGDVEYNMFELKEITK